MTSVVDNAKDTPSIRSAVRLLPGTVRLYRPARSIEHSIALQLEVLAGPVCDFLGARSGDELRIVVFGCSIGAEPYSIASIIGARRPDIRVSIECFDIEPDVIDRARTGRYSADEVGSSRVTPDFVDRTFDVVSDGMRVKREIAARVQFAVGDVLDETLIATLARADVVVAQNFLYHLPRPLAERAFANLITLLKPRSAFLVDGADIDMRTRLTAAADLRPCETQLERIHEESRVLRGYAWPRIYWGLGPFEPSRPDAMRRFATIFFREQTTGRCLVGEGDR